MKHTVPSDKAITIMCYQEVQSMELLKMVVMGRGLDFGRFLSYYSTHGTTGGVHGIWLDANDRENAKK